MEDHWAPCLGSWEKITQIEVMFVFLFKCFPGAYSEGNGESPKVLLEMCLNPVLEKNKSLKTRIAPFLSYDGRNATIQLSFWVFLRLFLICAFMQVAKEDRELEICRKGGWFSS